MQTRGINRYPIAIEGQTAPIGTANELAIALDVLQGQYDGEALAQLRPHLAEVIATASGFMLVMRSLSFENQLYLIEAIGPALAEVIQSAFHLRDILATMAEQKVEEVLLTTLGSTGLRRLILTAPELAEVLEWVYGQCDALVLDLLGDPVIRRMCRQAADLGAILHNLDASLQVRLLDQLGWPFVLGLVQDGRDLAYLLRALPSATSQELLRHFSGQRLKDLVGNSREWTYLYQRLEPAEADMLLSQLNA